MRVTTGLLYDRSLTSLQTLGARAERLQTEIAGGKRVINASDNAGSFGRLSLIKKNVASEKADKTNIDLASTLVAQSDSVLKTIETQLQRAKELATQGNNDALTTDQKKVIGQELSAIVDDLVSLANSQDARGQPLFGGGDSTTPFVRDADGKVTWQGTGTAAKIPIGQGGSIQATDSGGRLFTAEGGGTDIFAAVQAIADALTDGAGIEDDSVDALDASLDQIGTARASFGARGARLDLELDRLKDLAVDREAERSSLEDADVEQTIVELQKTMTVLQATQASFSRLSQLSLFNYLT